ncbi:TIGR02678 family protein [Tepidibacillus infernus]|uniref:Cytosolic protein n=1 Tax=Tepidibacillus decaturensis TaxID=1413211 RepID=A0A135L1S1_9BACI|nr:MULTISPECIES: TIGR02678 family protein [Tepidibacillus]KXG42948.1 cytosolic protein [Tepidibacillus decaturensis]GBF10902.1 hypothetical protein HK1_00918 [Tepidibacillus sp. HK-1]
MEKQNLIFDEVAQEVLEDLFEQFWILREKDPEKYQMIREREHALRDYFQEKFGYRFIVHRHFAKLEKIPVDPEPWMGIQMFIHPRDYALFACVLAFLEGKAVDEQFLLMEIVEDLLSIYPREEGIDWTNYEHRKSLVRVLKFSEEIGIVKAVDGDIEGFSQTENHEVLYEVPLISRYFMRSYPKDLFQFESMEEILKVEWMGEEANTGAMRRYRIYRKLFLSPVLYSEGVQDPDFQYLRNYRNRLREDIESHTPFQLELYKNTAMLTLPERKARFHLYPDNKGIMDVALQFSSIVREQQVEDEIPIQWDGSLLLTWLDFERWVGFCKEKYGIGWSKEHREASIQETTIKLFQLLEDWKLARRELDTGAVILLPALVRMIGRYPDDFNGNEEVGESEGE